MPYESRTSRKTIRLLSTVIANNRNFSGIWRSGAPPHPRICQIACFRLFEPLLDVLATLSDSEEVGELDQLPMHNLLLKL